jgi:hypothetical protein
MGMKSSLCWSWWMGHFSSISRQRRGCRPNDDRGALAFAAALTCTLLLPGKVATSDSIIPARCRTLIIPPRSRHLDNYFHPDSPWLVPKSRTSLVLVSYALRLMVPKSASSTARSIPSQRTMAICLMPGPTCNKALLTSKSLCPFMITPS